MRMVVDAVTRTRAAAMHGLLALAFLTLAIAVGASVTPNPAPTFIA